LRFAMRYIILY